MCKYSFIEFKYKGIKHVSKDKDETRIIKSQKFTNDSIQPYYKLKILKLNSIDDNIAFDKQAVEELNSKIKDKKIQSLELIDVFRWNFKEKFSDSHGEEEYVCIATKYIEEENKISNRTDKIRDRYKQEFLSLLKSLDSLHEANIVHTRISDSNIFYNEEDRSWKITDLYPRISSNLEGEKIKDLQQVAETYKSLFKNQQGNNPFNIDSSCKIVINDILNEDPRITKTKDVIRILENKVLLYSKVTWIFVYDLIDKTLELRKKITLASLTALALYGGFLLILAVIIALVMGKDPIEIARKNLDWFSSTSNLLPSSFDQKLTPIIDSKNVLSNKDFYVELQEIKANLDEKKFDQADIKTRELMLKVFSDRGDTENTSKVVNGSIVISHSDSVGEFEKNRVSTKQKNRIKIIDKIWFKGTKGKHGFHRQQSVYETSYSNYNCKEDVFTNPERKREIRHVDDTFSKLGWGENRCKSLESIPSQISRIMTKVDSWSVKRLKIQDIFKKNGGYPDGENVPDGYYPITAGLVAHTEFPQFAKWCEYTESDLK
jgi:hypothetical protein